MVINLINEIRRIEDQTGMDTSYRAKDPKDFDKFRDTRYSSSSSSSNSSNSRSSSSDRRDSYKHKDRSSSKKLDKYDDIDDKWHSKLLESRQKHTNLSPQRYNSYPTNEMGVMRDGRTLAEATHMSNERAGMGHTHQENDLNQFRMNMSMKYQQHNEDRAKGITEDQR